MKYIIYEPASKAAVRRDMITNDAGDANFLTGDAAYNEVVYHPTEDKAALPVIIIDPIYYQGFPVQGLDFSIFFTAQEIARAIEKLPEV